MKKISNSMYKTLKEMKHIKFFKIKKLIVIYKDVYDIKFREIALNFFYGIVLILLVPIQFVLAILIRMPKIFIISENADFKEPISRKVQRMINNIKDKISEY